MTDQPSLIDIEPPALPEGFCYEPDFLDREEERALVTAIKGLPFKPFEFHGFEGKRRVVSFGWRYDFKEAKLREAPPIPDFLHAAGAKAARFAELHAHALEQLLVTEYHPGAPIGWHIDRPIFADVIGVSLLASCTFRFRRKSGGAWARASLMLEPGSVYLLRGPARTAWEHSIPPVEKLRYSLTFRTFRKKARP
ncbi:alpha-ketoglutarate-dependent dioxygenase AlkB [Roseiarcus sp.]|uniref:alpha-ketoglutarate-dependent dioxygenase AlkB n=1 Tax=Roseiarcus sp. TaxID=1969460 RepID=UPI003F9D8CF1